MARPVTGLLAFALAAFCGALSAPAVRATQPLDPAGVAFFESRVRPVLVQHCYECHSADAAARKKLKGGLRLDTRDAALAGGAVGRRSSRERLRGHH